MTRATAVLAALAGSVILLAGAVAPSQGPGGRAPAATGAPGFVGREVCAGCHQAQLAQWQGSHHDLAMQAAADATVLGDFDDVSFTYGGVTSTFYRRDGRVFVRTDGPDGDLHDYEIGWAFGVAPLQQYLIAFPDGRVQALGIAWDSRPAAQGGQRWFHLYPDEVVDHDHPLHWTALNQNWNFMCAECHSTRLRRNYDLDTDTYATTWAEIDVSCEACHGPGADHVAWAAAYDDGTAPAAGDDMGLAVRLAPPPETGWVLDEGTVTARRAAPLEWNAQAETCGRCHSRRVVIGEDYLHGRPLADAYTARLLVDPLYFPDGQIRDEVYVYGSFLQSRMYEAGVVCSDCHEPHGARLYAEGNAVCGACHVPDAFDTPDHHHHAAGSEGAQCVACHMPARTYMVVDPRRDHSFRVPRPDLAAALGTPDACTGCHTDRTAAWAAEMTAAWYDPGRGGTPHFGEALHAGEAGAPGADRMLAALAGDDDQPAIVRGTAAELLGRYPGRTALRALVPALADEDPLVRAAALGALEMLRPADRVPPAAPLLGDPVRTVRIAAARVLAPAPRAAVPPERRGALDAGIEAYIAAQHANAERPEAHLNLGLLYADLGRFDEAEAAYRTALRLYPRFVQAHLNLSDLYRVQRRDAEGEALLREALALAPDWAELHHALGLLLVRRGRRNEALAALAEAARLAPDNARFAYVHGVALISTGAPREGVAALEAALDRHPADRDILVALATTRRDLGDIDAALRHAETLARLYPDDADALALVHHLRRFQAR